MSCPNCQCFDCRLSDEEYYRFQNLLIKSGHPSFEIARLRDYHAKVFWQDRIRKIIDSAQIPWERTYDTL